MSTLQFHWFADYIRNGVSNPTPFPIETPIKITEAPGLFCQNGEPITIAAGATVDLWAYTETNGGDTDLREFTGLAFQIDGGEGFVWLTLVTRAMDATTHMPSTEPVVDSGNDLQLGLACHMPQTFTSQAVKIAGTEGRLYKVRGTNPGSEDVTVRKFVWG